MKSYSALIAAVLLAVLAAACGGSSDTAASPTELDGLATMPAVPSPATEDEGPGTDTVPSTSAPEVEDEGPGTDTAPSAPEPQPQVEDEGPGTDTVPAPPAEGAREDEGPGTEGHADVAPTFGTETPSTYRVVGVDPGDVLHIRADPDPGGAEVGTFAHDAIDINSTGRIATAGDQVWREVEVPGGTVGWVHTRYLEVQTPTS